MMRLSLLITVSLMCLTSSLPAEEKKLSWHKVTEQAAWQPRDSSGELVFKDQLWMFGGWFNSYEAPPRDVWKSADGKTWELVTKEAPWIHSDLPMTVTFKDKMWLMGGWYNGRLEGHSAGNEVWSSVDGKQWDQVTKHAGWTPRAAAAIVEFKGKMWILGGTENYYFGDEKSLKNDVWYSEDGKTWKLATANAGWSPRAYHQAAVLNGKMYVFGGGNYVPEYHAKNDVWSTEDGIHWKQETAEAPWHERLWFSSVVYRNRIWVIGGWSNNPSKNKNDAWYSQDGKHWTELKTDQVWKERHEHSTFVFQDKIWLAAGHAQPLSNQVWTLDIPKDWFEKKATTTSAVSSLPKTTTKLKSGQPVKIVCFGDSVTGVYYHTGSRRAYTDMLGIGLKRTIPTAKLTMVNAGISGNTTAAALARIERDVIKQKPDLVTVMFGLNDMSKLSLQQYHDNLVQIVNKCQASGAEVLLCTPNAVLESTGHPKAKLSKYCAMVQQVGQEMQIPVCDCYQQMEEFGKQHPEEFRLMMSNAIHPNMAGHKKMAELITEAISGKSVSLADVQTLKLAIPHTKAKLKQQQPIQIIAMTPLDTMVKAAFQKIAPDAQLEITSWETAGRTRRKLQTNAAAMVRSQKPDLVLLAIPRDAPFDSHEEFIDSSIWTMNYSLNFGKGGWDCVVFHPDVFASERSETKYDELTRKLVLGQDLTLVDRKPDETSDAETILLNWLQSQLD